MAARTSIVVVEEFTHTDGRAYRRYQLTGTGRLTDLLVGYADGTPLYKGADELARQEAGRRLTSQYKIWAHPHLVRRTLADLRAEWDAPFLADPRDETANAARTRLTRDLAAAILAADLYDRDRMERTRVGDMQIAGAGWSKERGDQADATAGRGTPEWAAALGIHEHATLTSDGGAAIREQWCTCPNDDVAAEQWVRYEYWTERGCEAHGFVHAACRKLLQTG
jgi:hypothetical protein